MTDNESPSTCPSTPAEPSSPRAAAQAGPTEMSGPEKVPRKQSLSSNGSGKPEKVPSGGTAFDELDRLDSELGKRQLELPTIGMERVPEGCEGLTVEEIA